MTIPASQIVKVVPRVINAGSTDLEISGLFLTNNPLCIYPGTMSFSSKAAVESYFGMDSDEYKAAVKYFMGYDNSFEKPKRLHFARLVLTAISGSIIGGQAADMEELKTISTGKITINIDGVEKKNVALDFSAANTQSDVAKSLATALGTADVAYNSNLNAFVVKSKTTGNNSSVSVATGESADALGLSVGAGATVSVGSDTLTPEENMDSIVKKNQNWVSFTSLEKLTKEQILSFAKWCNDQNVEYLYCPWTDENSDTIPNNKENLPNKLIDNNYEGTCLTFGGLEHAILVMTIGACIDWDRVNGLPTYAFKSQSGLAASVNDEVTAENLLSMNANYYGRWATRNDDFVQYYEGKMIAGSFGFADAYIGNIWLRNALQVAIMAGLNKTARVPYQNRGYTLIRAWCTDPINRAKVNGVIDAGVKLSEAQKAQLINEIGQDVADEILTNGYYLQVADPGAQARINRESPLLGLWYTYGGSVHKVDLPVTVVL